MWHQHDRHIGTLSLKSEYTISVNNGDPEYRSLSAAIKKHQSCGLISEDAEA